VGVRWPDGISSGARGQRSQEAGLARWVDALWQGRAAPLDGTLRDPYTSGTEMSGPKKKIPSGDVTAELVQLLPELAVTLYEAGPHDVARRRTAGEPLTGRQTRAVVFLAHRGRVTMGELADGLEISRAAASELVARLSEKNVVEREDDPDDRRVVIVKLAGPAADYADGLLARWRDQLEAVFALYPDIDPASLVAFLRALIRQLKGRSES
jgi:DNA-binding MarR family transcriptional regulator